MDQLNSQTFSPLYKQLTNKLYADVRNGFYPVGSKIPSESELCTHYGVSRVTVRKALSSLEQDGLLLRLQGKGTFIAEPKLKRNLRNLNGFTEVCRQTGKEASTLVLSAGLIQAPNPEADDLNLAQGDMVAEIIRIRLCEGEPVIYEKNLFAPPYTFLLEEDLALSVYDMLLKRHIIPDRATHELSLRRASVYEAKHLKVNQGDALLCLQEVIYTQTGEPLHTSYQLIRGDKYTFRI